MSLNTYSNILSFSFLKNHFRSHPDNLCFEIDENFIIKDINRNQESFPKEKCIGKNFLDYLLLKEERRTFSHIIKNQSTENLKGLQLHLHSSSNMDTSVYSIFFDFEKTHNLVFLVPVISHNELDNEIARQEVIYNMLFTMTEKMHSFKNEKGIINLILKNIAEVLKFETVVMFLKEENSNIYINKYAYGRKSIMKHLREIIIDIDSSEEDGIFYKTIKNKKSYFIKNILDPDEDLIIDEEILPILECRSLFTVPIIVQNVCMGVITVDREKKAFEISTTQKNLLTFFCNQAAIALSNFKFLEKEKNYSKDLKKEVEKKTAKLRKVNTKLQEIDKLKDGIIGITSHELRTPMTVIKGYASILLDQMCGTLNEKQNTFVQKIIQNTTALIDLVNNMLDLSKMESGEMELEIKEVKLHAVIINVIQDFQLEAEKKNIELLYLQNKKLTDSLCVLAHESSLKRVLINLLGNAFKFTPAQGKITIQVKDDNQFYKVEVQDDGCGIPKQSFKGIFDKFQQADTHLKRNYEGTGLGLPIVKGLIKKMGGDIKVESEVGIGST
ncbi:GAF domain-containing sensor histidine kinase, partial [Candidatus Peregrinibacteria bacterium]|nr:GAF domain-containing sensor histidine kinase [Candidatus Peregrinibacteria bacterium]